MSFGATIYEEHNNDFVIMFNANSGAAYKQVVTQSIGRQHEGTEADAITQALALGAVAFNTPSPGDVTVTEASAKRTDGSSRWHVEVTETVYKKVVAL